MVIIVKWDSCDSKIVIMLNIVIIKILNVIAMRNHITEECLALTLPISLWNSAVNMLNQYLKDEIKININDRVDVF